MNPSPSNISLVIEKLDVIDFRLKIQKRFKDVVNVALIEPLLKSKGLVFKSFGLCAKPFYNYYEICHTNDRGSSYVADPLNTIHIRLNSSSTRKKITYFSSIEINNIEGYYYLCCLAQTSFYKDSTGADYVVYKVKEDKIALALDKIFKHVEIFIEE